jgi:hypothetical protein
LSLTARLKALEKRKGTFPVILQNGGIELLTTRELLDLLVTGIEAVVNEAPYSHPRADLFNQAREDGQGGSFEAARQLYREAVAADAETQITET